MRVFTLLILTLLLGGTSFRSYAKSPQTDFVDLIMQLNFSNAKDKANQLDSELGSPYYFYLTAFFEHSGQSPEDDEQFYRGFLESVGQDTTALEWLVSGVYHLYNSPASVVTFQHLKYAIDKSMANGDKPVSKLALFAILELFTKELVQTSDFHFKYLDAFEGYMVNAIDSAWYYLNRMRSISKSLDRNAEEEWDLAYQDFVDFYQSNSLNDRLQIFFYYETAIYLKQRQQLEEAKQGFKRVIDYSAGSQFHRYQSFTSHLHLSHIYTQEKQYGPARKHLMESRSFRNLSDSLRSGYIYKLFGSAYFYAPQQMYDTAYKFMLQAKINEEHLSTRANSIRLVELNVELETAKKANVILQNEQKIRKIYQWNTTIVILALILAVLLGLLYLTYVKIRKQNEEIRETSISLAQKNDKIETLMKELHHRVKNNLQVISSLLGLQSRKLKDESARIAVSEGNRRIRAMSLIHQRLYQDEHVTSLNMKDYLSDLVHDIARSHGKSDVVLYVQVPLIEIDADTAMPLGLIVNELVNNAFKYAFEDFDKTPEISVVLDDGTHEDGMYRLTISDNGKGIDLEENTSDERSFGMKLVNLLITKQLKGALEVESGEGVTYHIKFKLS